MALTLQDRADLTLMSVAGGAPKVADLVRAMDSQYGDLPVMKEVNKTFSDLATKNSAQLKKLNTALEQNPGLADKIKANLGKDPESFRTNFLPAVFKNPENALALAEQTAKPAPKPIVQKTYGDPEPAHVVAEAAIGKAKASSEATVKANAAISKASTSSAATVQDEADQRFATKMGELKQADGFSELMDRVEKNQDLSAAMKAVMASNGTAAEREQSVDVLLKKTKENPKFFKNIVQQIDDYPGAVSGIASQIAGDPKNALSKLSELGEDGGMGGIGGMGMFAKMFTGAGAGGIMGMIMSLIKAVVGMFSGSSNHLVVGNNNNQEQYSQAVLATNAKPDQVAVIDGSGQVTNGIPAQTQATDQNKTKAPVQQLS